MGFEDFFQPALLAVVIANDQHPAARRRKPDEVGDALLFIFPENFGRGEAKVDLLGTGIQREFRQRKQRSRAEFVFQFTVSGIKRFGRFQNGLLMLMKIFLAQ